MDADVPLVVSEVNPDALDDARKGIIANPNCTTMVAMLPAKALHDAFGMTAMVATSYQAAGGAGQKGIDELAFQVPLLHEDIDAARQRRPQAARCVESSVHANTLAYNVVPMLGTLGDNGYTDEEMKLQNESRKILGLPGARGLADLRARAGDGRARDRGQGDVRARGRPRRGARGAARVPEPHRRGRRRRRSRRPGATRRSSAACASTSATRSSLNFFVVGDNLLKGAALNTVQLAELAVARGLVVAPA